MKKILIVEDDEDYRAVLGEMIEEIGYVSLQCGDAEAALQILKDNPSIDLLLTDIVLPGISGRDLVSALRSEEAFRNLPVVMVSGKISFKEIQELLDVGATFFLPKPVKLDHLESYIARAFEAGQ